MNHNEKPFLQWIGSQKIQDYMEDICLNGKKDVSFGYKTMLKTHIT